PNSIRIVSNPISSPSSFVLLRRPLPFPIALSELDETCLPKPSLRDRRASGDQNPGILDASARLGQQCWELPVSRFCLEKVDSPLSQYPSVLVKGF
ncbi:hypothetical protein BHM03_00043981, partial [Ensete ventricosum]